MTKITKETLVAIIFLILLGASSWFVSVKAAQTGVVTATVTAQNIGVVVVDGSVVYGTLGTGSSAVTTSGGTGLNDTQKAVNSGNITEDFNIMGQNSANWTLAGSAGSEQYSHKFCTTNCTTSGNWAAMTTGYSTLKTSVGTGATQPFDMLLNTPTTTANYTQQTVSVTVQAIAN